MLVDQKIIDFSYGFLYNISLCNNSQVVRWTQYYIIYWGRSFRGAVSNVRCDSNKWPTKFILFNYSIFQTYCIYLRM